jgi:spore germination cell wall hydrolase CwlJ-like protein
MKFLLLFLVLTAGVVSSGSAKSISLNNDVTCLAAAIYFEARGEILSAQVAVAQLTKIRVDSNFYLNDFCSVIKAFTVNKNGVKVCAYEWYCKNKLVLDLRLKDERLAWNRANVLARSFLSSTPPVFAGLENVTLFHDKSKTPWWAKRPTVRLVAIIGNLYFYEEYINGRLVASI